MIINKKFNDYYDNISQYGIDKTIVYDRILQQVDGDLVSPTQYDLRLTNYSLKPQPNYKFHLIGFCGKLYIGMEINYPGDYTVCDPTKKTEFYYGLDIIPNLPKTTIWGYYNNKKPDVQREEFIKKYHLSDLEMNQSPIAVQHITPDNHKDKFYTLNENLSDLQFYKIVDPYTAFTNIQSYISGVIGQNNKPLIEISDKSKILKAGFDLKSSFRNIK